jgi:hypothetical protein
MRELFQDTIVSERPILIRGREGCAKKLYHLARPTPYLVVVKHFLPTLTLLLALLSGATPTAPLRPSHLAATATHPTETVYVCMSKTAYAFHSSGDCNGLNRCSHEMKALSGTEAQKLGK